VSVLVLSAEGEPLLPTTSSKAGWLLRHKKAYIAKKIPFTIKLSSSTEESSSKTVLPISQNSNQKDVNMATAKKKNVKVSKSKVDSTVQIINEYVENNEKILKDRWKQAGENRDLLELSKIFRELKDIKVTPKDKCLIEMWKRLQTISDVDVFASNYKAKLVFHGIGRSVTGEDKLLELLVEDPDALGVQREGRLSETLRKMEDAMFNKTVPLHTELDPASTPNTDSRRKQVERINNRYSVTPDGKTIDHWVSDESLDNLYTEEEKEIMAKARKLRDRQGEISSHTVEPSSLRKERLRKQIETMDSKELCMGEAWDKPGLTPMQELLEAQEAAGNKKWDEGLEPKEEIRPVLKVEIAILEREVELLKKDRVIPVETLFKALCGQVSAEKIKQIIGDTLFNSSLIVTPTDVTCDGIEVMKIVVEEEVEEPVKEEPTTNERLDRILNYSKSSAVL
jgi:hypothetical protein